MLLILNQHIWIINNGKSTFHTTAWSRSPILPRWVDPAGKHKLLPVSQKRRHRIHSIVIHSSRRSKNPTHKDLRSLWLSKKTKLKPSWSLSGWKGIPRIHLSRRRLPTNQNLKDTSTTIRCQNLIWRRSILHPTIGFGWVSNNFQFSRPNYCKWRYDWI